MALSPDRWIEVAGERLLVRDLAAEDRAAVLALHADVFGGAASPAWYDWKYVQGGGQAVGVWQGHRLIAHCGGTPRAYRVHHRPVSTLQIGDVMVASQWRGVLTRHGPFFHVSQALYASRLGAEKRFGIGFGFPNERHLRLAVKSGLSWDAGRVHELQWSALDPRGWGGWRWRRELLALGSEAQEAATEAGWHKMSTDMQSLSVGVRSAAHLRWRYTLRPQSVHHVLALRSRWSREVLGIAVLGSPHADGVVHWLDWVGPLRLMEVASRMCRAFVSELGGARLVTWASAAVEQHLMGSGFVSAGTVAGIGVPVASDVAADDVPSLNWWFMSGDTDFL